MYNVFYFILQLIDSFIELLLGLFKRERIPWVFYDINAKLNKMRILFFVLINKKFNRFFRQLKDYLFESDNFFYHLIISKILTMSKID